jgi:hypothetical protein
MSKLLDIDGKPITILHLWAPTSAHGGSAGSIGQIYFSAGGKTNPLACLARSRRCWEGMNSSFPRPLREKSTLPNL